MNKSSQAVRLVGDHQIRPAIVGVRRLGQITGPHDDSPWRIVHGQHQQGGINPALATEHAECTTPKLLQTPLSAMHGC